MSTSNDIHALFDRFEGDASTYREIRVENEARDARDRWPLLGLVDPRRFEAGPAHGPAGAATAQASAQAEVPHGATQAERRRTAPLFAHSPRRDLAQPGDPDLPNRK